MQRNLNEPGLLVVIEGIDGAGKTTLAGSLRDHFEAHGRTVVTGKEPTQGPWGQKLRNSAQHGRFTPELELEYLLNDRRQHLDEVILPALAEDAIVLLDRYYYSTAAYQGAAGLDPVGIILVNEDFAPRPDVVFLLDLEPRTGLERIRARGDIANAFEREDTLETARGIFRQVLPPQPAGVLVDALQPAETVFQIALGHILRIMADKSIALHGFTPAAADHLMVAGFGQR